MLDAHVGSIERKERLNCEGIDPSSMRYFYTKCKS